MVLFIAGCGVKPELLPVKNYPHIEKVRFLKKIIFENGNIKKSYFKNGISSPFIIFFELKDVSGKGYVVLKIYNEKKKVYEKKFFFGKEGKLYDSIIIWDRVDIKKYKKLKYTIFYKKNLLYEGEILNH